MAATELEQRLKNGSGNKFAAKIDVLLKGRFGFPRKMPRNGNPYKVRKNCKAKLSGQENGCNGT